MIDHVKTFQFQLAYFVELDRKVYHSYIQLLFQAQENLISMYFSTTTTKIQNSTLCSRMLRKGYYI